MSASQKFLVHPVHDSGGMLIRQMGVTLDHGECLVPQHVGDFSEAGSTHGEVAGGGMAQVMKPELLYSRVAQGRFPGPTECP